MSKYFTILRDIENFSKERSKQLDVEELNDNYLRLGFDTCHKETAEYLINSRKLNRKQSRMLYSADISTYAEVTQNILKFNEKYYKLQSESSICSYMKNFNDTFNG